MLDFCHSALPHYPALLSFCWFLNIITLEIIFKSIYSCQEFQLSKFVGGFGFGVCNFVF